ncbi:MAG: DUF4134 domain-containing protein [Puia sp.]|nr:DUF4134 domain-containing protein [Puia sp.]
MKSKKIKVFVYGAMIEAGLLIGLAADAQTDNGDGATGITKATSMLQTYFDDAISLMYIVGAIVGLIGAIRVYLKWSHGDHDTGKVAAAWFSACIFLVVVASVLKSFFGVT